MRVAVLVYRIGITREVGTPISLPVSNMNGRERASGTTHAVSAASSLPAAGTNPLLLTSRKLNKHSLKLTVQFLRSQSVFLPVCLPIGGRPVPRRRVLPGHVEILRCTRKRRIQLQSLHDKSCTSKSSLVVRTAHFSLYYPEKTTTCKPVFKHDPFFPT